MKTAANSARNRATKPCKLEQPSGLASLEDFRSRTSARWPPSTPPILPSRRRCPRRRLPPPHNLPSPPTPPPIRRRSAACPACCPVTRPRPVMLRFPFPSTRGGTATPRRRTRARRRPPSPRPWAPCSGPRRATGMRRARRTAWWPRTRCTPRPPPPTAQRPTRTTGSARCQPPRRCRCR